MPKKKVSLFVAALLVLSMVLAACATPATPTTEPAAPTEQAVATTAPTMAPEPTQAPAQPTATEAPAPTDTAMPAGPDPSGQSITFWHVWGTGDPSDAINAIVDDFNANNEWGITVKAVDQGNYSDLEDALNVAIQSGDLPNLAVGYSNALANWWNVGTLADLNTYINDPQYGLTQEEQADFYPGILDSAKVAGGERIGFPISQSGNVLFYNKTWAQELGFDNPPTTTDEFKQQACAAAQANNSDDNPDNDGTGGLVLDTGASNVASWVFAFGGNIVKDDGSGYAFNTPVVKDVATFLKDLWDSGCAFQTESYPNPEFASRKALFTTSSTAGLPYQIDAFNAEGAIKDDWGFISFPGPDGSQAVDSYGQTIGLVNTTPEQNMAAWLFLKYFSSPEVQAKWINASAYYPTRASVVPLLQDYAAANPKWESGLSLLQYGHSEPARPSWTTVRRDVGDTFSAILQSDPSQIDSLLQDLDSKAAQAVSETDQ